MNMQLIVAARRDPVVRPVSAADAAPLCTSILLNGKLDDVAVRAITETIENQVKTRCESVVVTMEDVVADAGPLQALAASIMRLRAAGSQVQLATRDHGMYDRLAPLPDSRDWLIGFAGDEVSGVRRAIHLDGPHLGDR